MKRKHHMVRSFELFLAGALLGVSALLAQNANPLSSEVKWSYGVIQNNLLKLAEKMPAEYYNFRPTPDVETFARRIAHIADANMNVCAGLNGERKTLGAASKTAKADLVAALKESFAYCDKAYNSVTDASGSQMVNLFGRDTPRLGVLIVNNMHNMEHYGNMVTYMRIKGIVPPTSEQPPPAPPKK